MTDPQHLHSLELERRRIEDRRKHLRTMMEDCDRRHQARMASFKASDHNISIEIDRISAEISDARRDYAC